MTNAVKRTTQLLESDRSCRTALTRRKDKAGRYEVNLLSVLQHVRQSQTISPSRATNTDRLLEEIDVSPIKKLMLSHQISLLTQY